VNKGKKRDFKMEDFDNFPSAARKIDQDRINIDALDDAAALDSVDIVKLRQENAELKKEMQAMESRLKSNMKSIKTFWSPELKKEKAAKIEKEDQFLALHEQYTTLSKEAQVFHYLFS
jgi:ELKS/RAB6-interacting/CAST family protein 1